MRSNPVSLSPCQVSRRSFYIVTASRTPAAVRNIETAVGPFAAFVALYRRCHRGFRGLYRRCHRGLRGLYRRGLPRVFVACFVSSRLRNRLRVFVPGIGSVRPSWLMAD
jgi:hypothetical protein